MTIISIVIFTCSVFSAVDAVWFLYLPGCLFVYLHISSIASIVGFNVGALSDCHVFKVSDVLHLA